MVTRVGVSSFTVLPVEADSTIPTAAELDATFGRDPDLEKMPMYGVVFSFKDPFDTKDMRSTGGGDARYDIDFPARDHILVEQLRNKGAIIFAKAAVGRGIRAADTNPTRCYLRFWDISVAPGAETPSTPTTPPAPPPWARVRGQLCRLAPIW